MICIWDKERNEIISSDDPDLFIGADGKVYEITIEYGFGDHAWLHKEEVSRRYEVRYDLNFLIK